MPRRLKRDIVLIRSYKRFLGYRIFYRVAKNKRDDMTTTTINLNNDDDDITTR